MKLFNILAILITLSAAFSYINHRFIRWPTTIGLMVIALLVSLGLIALEPLGFGLKEDARLLLDNIDFDETLLHGMLSFLLFAGALHVNLTDLARQKYIIGSLATVGVVGSTFIHLLSIVRCADLTHRSDCGNEHSKKGRSARKS
jgi:CPA1 family monovalent cation:H+ antiporter